METKSNFVLCHKALYDIISVSRLQRFFVSNQSAATLVNLWPRQPEDRVAAFCIREYMNNDTKNLFMNKIEVVDGCWVWHNYRQADGYGVIHYGRKSWLAHRLMWTLENGEIPDGMEICHHCDNPPCVNPMHLFIGTHGDNVRDSFSKGRSVRYGEHHSQNKLMRNDVIKIRKIFNETDFQDGGIKRFINEMAEQYNMTSSGIEKVIYRQTWRHV